MMTVPSTMMPRSIAPTDKQIGRVAAQHRDDDGEKQRHRNGRRHDQRAAQIAEEHPLDQEDQRDAEQHIVHHRAHRDRDQVAAVVERIDLDAGRQAAVAVDALDRRAHPRHHVHGALELLHQHDAEHDVVLVVAAGDAEARREADLIVRDVRQHHRQSALLAHHDIVDVADRAERADAAHVDRLFADRDGAAADIGIAGGNRVDDLRQRQPVGPHAVEIDFGLVFLGLAAQHRNVGDARHDAQFAFHHPVLQRLELDQVHAGRTLELIAQDFADAAGRRNHRRDGRRQRRVLQPVDDLLAHEIVVAAIFELQADEAEREHRVGADIGEAGRAGDCDLQRDGDVALDFLGRLAGKLRDDLDDRRRRIGIGLDVERREGGIADAEEGREGDQRQRPPRQAKRNQMTQHGRVSFRRRRGRRTGCPWSRPFRRGADRRAPEPFARWKVRS